MAGEPGFEPGPTESESAVLPLYYSPKSFYINDLTTTCFLLYLLLSSFVPVYQNHAPTGKALLNGSSDRLKWHLADLTMKKHRFTLY